MIKINSSMKVKLKQLLPYTAPRKVLETQILSMSRKFISIFC